MQSEALWVRTVQFAQAARSGASSASGASPSCARAPVIAVALDTAPFATSVLDTALPRGSVLSFVKSNPSFSARSSALRSGS